VAAGRYFVRGRASNYLLEGTVSLVGGEERSIPDDALERIEYARFVRKGAGELRAVHGLQAGWHGRSAVFSGGGCMGPYLGYAIEARHFDLTSRIGLCRGLDERARDAALGSAPGTVRPAEIGLDLRLSRTWDVWRLAMSVGVAPGVAMISDAAEVQGGLSERYRTVATLGSTLGVAMDLSGPLYASLELGARTYVQRKRTQIYGEGGVFRPVVIDTRDELDADLVLELSAGIGMRW
jgi:hypothetical protein